MDIFLGTKMFCVSGFAGVANFCLKQPHFGCKNGHDENFILVTTRLEQNDKIYVVLHGESNGENRFTFHFDAPSLKFFLIGRKIVHSTFRPFCKNKIFYWK